MVAFSFTSVSPSAAKTLVFLASTGGKLTPEAAKLDASWGGAVTRAIKIAEFKGKKGKTLTLITPHANAPDYIVVVGLGETTKLDFLAAEHIGSSVALALAGLHREEASVLADAPTGLKKISVAELAAHLAHGAQLRTYNFQKYKPLPKGDEGKKLKQLTFTTREVAKAKKLFGRLEKIGQGVALARDLVHEPPNVLTPEVMADAALQLKNVGVKVSVLDEVQMKKLGMGSLLGVAQGSTNPPRLVCMSWNGNPKAKDARPLALIGKGVTFDSGGISLKPGQGMDEMKYDMAGAAAVIGTISALAARKAKVNVVGLIGLVENMPSGHALRPGDILTSGSGKTIEVLNTDAEGRLVLADVLWYAQKHFKPRLAIDLATLTGAIGIALGQEYAGLFSNDDKLAAQLTKAGQAVDELLWRMPLCEAFDKMIDSSVADIRNLGGSRHAGSCTAAQFIGRFVEKDLPWAHLDIAGTAFVEKDRALSAKGPTGFGVRLLNRFIADNFEA